MRRALGALLLGAVFACAEPEPWAAAEAAYARQDYTAAAHLYARALRAPPRGVSPAWVRARLGLTQ